MNTYVYSDAERTELGISAIYNALSEFPHSESKTAIVINTAALFRLLILFVVSLAVVNIAAILYIVSMWS